MEHSVDVVKEDKEEDTVEVYFDIDEFNELMEKDEKIDFIKSQTKKQYKDVKKVHFKKKDLKELQEEIDDICDPSDMLPNETYSELTIELVKIICLAIGNLYITIKLGDTTVDVHGVIYLTISTVCNALICYFFIWYTKHTYNLHGEKGYKLEYLSGIIFAIFAFILKCNIVVCFIIFCVFNLSYGYTIWSKKELHEKQEKVQAESESKEKKKKQKERRKNVKTT